MAKKRSGLLRRAFFAGLATLLPTVLTIFIITFFWNVLEERIARPITGLIEQGLATEWAKEHFWKGHLGLLDVYLDDEITPDTPGDQPFKERVDAYVPSYVGFVIGLILVFLVGFLFKGYVGRQAIRLLESWLLRIPLIKVIYPYAKQVTEFFFQEKKQIQYQSCVTIEYPRRGVYSLGFVTSEGFRQISEYADSEVVAIFIPSSPTPVTGYTVLVPKSDIHPLDMTVDEALRFTISGGVILPPKQVPPLALKTRRLEKPGEEPEEKPEEKPAPEEQNETS